ncbi:IMPACT family protein [Nafulsella turpanensis]|uniref:IMPACT family protein n=1 Tax=Nafulsella turpanensis TaxID=1265690 RepID=UPI000345F250|nr:YigZ family protein [Nafulsella turpanensis]
MAEDTFLTLSRPAESLYKEKGSKFIGLAYPITSEEEVKEVLEDLRKTYYDARHHCYAYIIGAEGEKYRANDDGEPNHSAGDPILGQIKSNELTNTLVVVVRYFGGTKLGVSGLITAYKTAAADAIAASEIIEEVVKERLHIRYGYESTNEVMRLIKEYELDILEQEFTADCRMLLAVRQSFYPSLMEKLEMLEEVTMEENS